MKSPAEARAQLAKQWESNDTRAARLLDGDAWPVVIGLVRPSPQLVARSSAKVRAHLDAWRKVKVGRVEWEPTSYRAASEPIDVPVQWVLETPSQWVAAISDRAIEREFSTLSRLVEAAHPRYRSLLVRRRSLVLGPKVDDVLTALHLAEQLSAGCAEGAPLRTLPLAGVDTKFYERNATLLTALLDIRFEGTVVDQGLETFLGAAGPDGHWLLVADLDGTLLEYRRIRVTDTDLAETGVPGSRIIVVENEKCLHVLPPSPDTIAILGAGLNLGWLASDVFRRHAVAYWGDLDTWGLSMLATARAARADLTAILMDEATFTSYEDRAVTERTPAHEPAELLAAEHLLFARLSATDRGRLEQEFLPRELVHRSVHNWLESL